jgi:hypothetical protein
MSKTTLALPFALALVVSALGCSPEVPAVPTYAKDVQPIFAAHCVRCHGETLQAETLPDGGTGLGVPKLCHLNRLGNLPADCPDPATCSYGAAAPVCIPFILAYTADDNLPKRMPPAPSDPLNDWEKDVVKRWASTSPPAP